MSPNNNSNKKQKTEKKPLSGGKIELQHFVRLRYPGDGKNKSCANTATKLWKTKVCKEDHKKEDKSLDLDAYKQSLKTELEKKGIAEDPIFVCGAEKLSNANWFENDKPACVDENGNKYYRVKDSAIEFDLTQSRESGQTRNKENNRPVGEAVAASPVSSALQTPPTSPGATSTTASFSPIMTGILAQRSNFAALDAHERLRSKIEASNTVEKCVQVFDNPFFKECLEALSHAQEQYLKDRQAEEQDGVLSVESFAKLWAHGVSNRAEWAKILEDCRKTAFLLLKKVCDLWNWNSLEDEKRSEDA